MKNLFTTDARFASPRLGVVHGSINAVIVIQVLTIIVEALLGLIIVFALALMANSRFRRSQLVKDPASVTDFVDMMTPSISLGGIKKLPKKPWGSNAM